MAVDNVKIDTLCTLHWMGEVWRDKDPVVSHALAETTKRLIERMSEEELQAVTQRQMQEVEALSQYQRLMRDMERDQEARMREMGIIIDF